MDKATWDGCSYSERTAALDALGESVAPTPGILARGEYASLPAAVLAKWTPAPVVCKANTKAGKPCKAKAVKGDYCNAHKE